MKIIHLLPCIDPVSNYEEQGNIDKQQRCSSHCENMYSHCQVAEWLFGTFAKCWPAMFVLALEQHGASSYCMFERVMIMMF